jgi:predicted transcriptional regulator
MAEPMAVNDRERISTRSVHDDYIVCLEDRKKFKSLKRHLATHHDLTPNGYRVKWKLHGEQPARMTIIVYCIFIRCLAAAS